MHLLKEEIVLQLPEHPDHKFTEHLGGYSYCFNLNRTDDIEEVVELVLDELFEDLMKIIERDGVYAIGWICKRYAGTGTYQ